MDDEGTYACAIKNSSGENRCSCRLTVTGINTFPCVYTWRIAEVQNFETTKILLNSVHDGNKPYIIYSELDNRESSTMANHS